MNEEIRRDNNKGEKLSFMTKWGPAVIVCIVAFLVMLLNMLTVNLLWVYTLTMVAASTLSGPFAVIWGKKHPITTVQMLFNVIAVFAFILLISFLFMVLPSLVGGVAPIHGMPI